MLMDATIMRSVLLVIFLFSHGIADNLHSANTHNCNAQANSCQNDGRCQEDGLCLCSEGWQGSECQFCGGKVRLYQPFGTIHDGWGNYSVSVRCSWLIDASHLQTNRTRNEVAPKPPTIRIRLKEFATECGWDHFYIYDGDSVDSPLLAVFSGLMYRGNFSVSRVPEVVARSGTALLHFFSDDAYNMSGFTLAYKINACPTAIEGLECSGHGKCDNGNCKCEPYFAGDACAIAACPNGCQQNRGLGICNYEQQKCICREDYGGDDCSQLKAIGAWDSIRSQSVPADFGSASHGAAVWNGEMYVVGGESYGRSDSMAKYSFNSNSWEVLQLDDMQPAKRYGFSLVTLADKMYMYGGVLTNHDVSNELWTFNMTSKVWDNVKVKTSDCRVNGDTHMMCGPLRVSGHSATLAPSSEDRSYQKMIVIFGHSPDYGYLNVVQEFDFSTHEWRIIDTKGYIVKGTYGHTAAYDQLTEKIYVFGGITSDSETNHYLSSRLYAFDARSYVWTLLTSAPIARLLHSGNFLNPGLMMVFGGNTHNDTSQSYGAKCYSQDLYVYDVICDSWHLQTIPAQMQADIARFGHSAVVYRNALYINGGFNGQMLSDILRFTPGSCKFFTKQERCTSARPGLKCIWDVQKGACMSIVDVHRSAIFSREQDDYITCPPKSRLTMTSELLNDVSQCQEIKNCQACVSTTFHCTYCGNSVCSREKCREASFVDSIQPKERALFNVKYLDDCPNVENSDFYLRAICEQLHSCHACLAKSGCYWEADNNRCRVHFSAIGLYNSSRDHLKCPAPCDTYKNCQNCSEKECIWCHNLQRCLDRNAYTATYPYGQCREWATFPYKCRSASSVASRSAVLPSAQCGFYNSCAQCLSDPACGWCDDGSKTGLGQCIEGGDMGPYDVSLCPPKQWSFTWCPKCNCNGHSFCNDSVHCEQPCSNLTSGSHCELCLPGYWGNPINGGRCQKCECNNHAESCNASTGKCYCSTKGVVGDYCEKCDAQNLYFGNPLNGSCFYELTIDYQFTFNLSKKEDRHYKQINFVNSPTKPDTDADFTISCSVPAKLNITMTELGNVTRTILSGQNCSSYQFKFHRDQYRFGYSPGNTSMTVFYVSVYDFQPPIWIQIAFSQYPKLNLRQFLVTFASCFVLLLLIAAVMWKVKQRYDSYRRRQRMFVEMEQMASRPFAQVTVDVEKRENIDLDLALNGIQHMNKKRKRESPSPIALEPCNGNRAAVLTLLVRLPTGGLPQAPPGHPAGLAVASALVTLGNTRQTSIDHSKDPKLKRKQSQHPDSCT